MRPSAASITVLNLVSWEYRLRGLGGNKENGISRAGWCRTRTY